MGQFTLDESILDGVAPAQPAKFTLDPGILEDKPGIVGRTVDAAKAGLSSVGDFISSTAKQTADDLGIERSVMTGFDASSIPDKRNIAARGLAPLSQAGYEKLRDVAHAKPSMEIAGDGIVARGLYAGAKDDAKSAYELGQEAISGIEKDKAIKQDLTKESEKIRKQFARDHPYLAGAMAGTSSMVSGIEDFAPLAADTVNQIINPWIKLAGGSGFGNAARLPGAEYFEQAQKGYTPGIAKKKLDDLKDGELPDWLAANAAMLAPQVAGSFGAALLPKVRALYLGTMGAMSSGGSYNENKQDGVEKSRAIASAWTDGAIEILSEMLPLHVFDKVQGVLRKLPLAQRAGLAGEIFQKTLASTGAFATQSGAEGIEEMVAQLGQNASKKYIAGNEKTKLMDGVKEAGVLGAMMGAPTGAVHAGTVAKNSIEDSQAGIGRAMDEALAGASYSQQGIQNEAIARLDPNGTLAVDGTTVMPSVPAVNPNDPTLTRAAQAAAIHAPQPTPSATADAALLAQLQGQVETEVSGASELISETDAPVQQETAAALPTQQPAIVNESLTVQPGISPTSMSDTSVNPLNAQPATTQEIPAAQLSAIIAPPPGFIDIAPPAPQSASTPNTSEPVNIEATPPAAQPPILHKNGKPFKTKGDARLALDTQHKALKATHQIVAIDSGFGLAEKPAKVRSVAQIANDKKLADKRKLNTDTDSISMAVRKLGGINKTGDLAGEIRDLKFGSSFMGAVWKNDGKGIGMDQMARLLASHGYVDDSAVDGGVQEMLDKLREDHFGTPQPSAHASGATMEAAAQAHYEAQQEAHDMTQDGFDTLSEEDQAVVMDGLEVEIQEEADLDNIPFDDADFEVLGNTIHNATLEETFGELDHVRENQSSPSENEPSSESRSGTDDKAPNPEETFGLEGQTNAEINAADKKAKAAADKAEREANKSTGPDVTADQVDIFNTQGGFDLRETPASQQASKPSTNTIFTEDAAAAARALLKKKLGQVNTGLDPEVMQAGITLAGYHIEKGARTFTAYAKAMIEDLGDVVKPYLKSWFLGVKFDPRAAAFSSEMDSAASVEAVDVDSLQADKPAGPLHIFKNEDTGMESHVVTGTNGRFNVVQKDTDSGEFTLEAKIFPTEDAAIAYAKTINPEPKQDVPETNFGNITEKLVNDKLETNLPEVEHVTKGGAGKTIQGVIAMTLTEKQARTLDPTGTFKKDGGWFIRMRSVIRPEVAKAETAPTKDTFVGRNEDGKAIYQDARGVRFHTDNGFRVSESVGIIPGGGIEIRNRKDEYKTVDELVQTDEEVIEGVHKATGRSDFKAGKPRVLPSYFSDKTGKNAKDWYRGWDAANIAEPIDSATLKSGITDGEEHASPIQAEPVSEGTANQAESDAATGNRDSEPLGAGLAAGSEGAGGSGAVSGSTTKPGGTGAGSVEQAGERPSGAPRNNAGVRPESGATGSDADFVIDAEEIGKGGLTKKYRDNIAAIKIIKAMESESRVATPEERKQIAKYVGWGALKGVFDPANKQWTSQHEELKGLLTDAEFKAARKSTLDAHYTSPIAVKAMYDAMERMGFTGGRILEPSVGVGNFFGLMPTAMRNASNLHGVELDALTSRLVAALYPKAKIAQSTGFEDFQIPAEYFDAAIGNPPFGSTPLVDSERSPYSGFSIHNYFLAKAIDKLRPGGIMQVVVSHNFLDAQDGRARKWIAERANLIGAARLPNTAFKENAGTEVVTDIVIFQKKSDSEYRNGIGTNPMWVNAEDQINHNAKTGDSATHKVNKFFIAYPNNILGKPSSAGSMYGPNEYTVEASGNLNDQLAGWVNTLPKNIFDPIDRRSDKSVVDMSIPDGIKPGSFYVDASGKIMQRGQDVMGNKTANAWTPTSEKATGRMVGMIELRDSLRQQMRLERSLDATQGQIEANREKMNRQYDAFLKQYGHINNQVNRKIFLDDTEAQLLQALEFDFDKGISKAVAEREELDPRDPSAIKADIFNRRVAFPPQDFLTVTTAKDALLASLNYRGKVDAAYMAEVYHKSADEIVKELGDVVFDDPQSGIVTADEYLSGDVKTKLAEAKAAAHDDPKYKRNVEALEPVIPADKKPSEISASIGASFVPAETYEQFVKHITGGTATAVYIKATGQWLMSYHGQAEPALNVGKFGTSDMDAQQLFQLSMAGRGSVVKKIIKNGDGSTTTILLEKETEAAREKQNAIKAEWQKWLWSEPARADKIASIYNEKMNRIVERKFDGAHMTFPGMNPAISLLEHQKNGVWRGLQSYQVLYDHVVGAGKTFVMATLAMEMRRLGIARKPLFAVPNHLTLQWRSEFTRLYPGSNILAATPEDFNKGNRERMFSKIITGDWDAVVIGHSSLKKIGLPEATEKAVLQEQIDEISEAVEMMKRERGDRNIIGDMEKIKKNLEAKMKDKLAAIGSRDKVVTFDELGVDAMFVDEMHEFKNLTYNSTMDRNPGMGNPAGSAKAFDMFVKTRYLFDTFGDKTPYVTATGTPVSNSLVEMFNMQRYMQYPTLKRNGLNVFDAWAKQFGSVENVYEVAPSGSGYRQSTRFAKFNNLPALMGLYNTFADTVTLDDLKAQEEAQGKRFPVPKIMGGRPTIVVAKRSPLVSERMGVPRAEVDSSGKVQFDLQADSMPEIEQNKDTGKWTVKAKRVNAEGVEYLKDLGTFDTEEDARLKVVERALSPVVTVDPESILGRFGRLRELTRATKGKVNALSLTGEANKAGLDYRLIDPSAPDFAGSKINLAVDNIMKSYRQWATDKGAQLVFCDMSIPLSARASYGSKARRLYVQDESHAIEMKRGTLHTLEGHEDIPYFIVQRGDGDAKRFEAYDAVSGGKLFGDMRTRMDSREKANALLANMEKRQEWIGRREALGEITQEQIDEYNNEHDVETEGIESFTREDIAGVSGASKFSVYDDIKAKLIAKGMPEREIAFIHDYSTPTAKDKLFKAVNEGSVRVLLGSTPKMGAGTNVQKRLVALHHIDAPWRPSDLEQREGRIIRRGNMLYERDPGGFEIFIGRYATEQTYDTRRWQILEHKARGIEQLRNFDGTINEIDDIEGEAANSADMKAAASGDPLILDETKLRNDVRRLEQLQAGHADEVLALTRRAKREKEYSEVYGKNRIAELQSVQDEIKKYPLNKDGFSPVTVEGKKLSDKEKAQDEIASIVGLVRSGLRGPATIVYRGAEFTLSIPHGTVMMADSPTGTLGTWSPTEPFSPSGFIQRMANYAARLPAAIEEAKAEVVKSSKDAVALSEQAKEPFTQTADLDHAREEHKKVQRALMAKGPSVPEEQKAAVDQGIQEQKAKLEKMGFGNALREMFGNNAPLFSRNQSGSGLPIPAIQSIVDQITAKMPRLDGVVHVVQSASELPIGGLYSDIEGAFLGKTGEIYLVADNISSIYRAKKILAHESVGHLAMEEMLNTVDPKLWGRLVNQIDTLEKTGNKLINSLAKTVDERQPGLSKTNRVKEVLALMAEDNIQNDPLFTGAARTTFQRFIDGIKAFMKLVFDVQMTDKDVLDLVKMAERHLGEKAGRSSVVAGMKEAINFSKSKRGEFGPVFDSLKGNFEGGVTKLMEEKTGEIPDALFHKDVGHIDLVWGVAGNKQSDYAGGYGLSHILAKHPEINPFDLEDIVHRSKYTGRHGNSVELETPDHMTVVKLDWAGGAKKWLLTAYEKNPSAVPDKIIGVAGNTASAPLADQEAEGNQNIASSPKNGKPDDLYSRSTTTISQQTALPGVSKTPPPSIPQQPSLGLSGGVSGNNASWDAPESSKFDTFLYHMQNKHVDMKRVKDAVEKSFGALQDKWNPYLKEELFHERAASRIKGFVESELTPMLEIMAKEKIGQGDLGRYLWARHAKEANAYIATINSKLPDGGSGMTNKESADYMAAIDPAMKQKLEALALQIDAINHKTRLTLVNYGLISPNDVTTWENTYKHYIPLNREDMDHLSHGNGMGQGFSIKGSEAKRRTGSELAVAVDEILGSIAMQRERAITRGEKNRVGLALFGMAKLNPNPEFWSTDKAPTIKVVQKINGQDQVVEMVDPLYKSQDNVVVVKIPNTRTGKVEEHAIVFDLRNERAVRMASAIKNLDGVQLGELMGASAKVTRYFASINTQYNPIFGVLNLTRDVQTAMLNLSNTPLAGKQLKILNDTRSILAGAMKHGMRDFDGQWKTLADEFHAEGGATGYRDLFRTGKERAEAIQHALDPDWWTKTKWGKAITLKGYIEFPMVMAMDKGLRPVLNWLSDYNETMENAVRLAAYKEAKAMGLSKEQASSIAKNLTVNFNRKGEKAMQVGAMYAFFNAAVQGMTRDGATLRGPAGKRIILGGVLIGAIQAMALAFAGFGDDEPPEFVKERNLIFPIGNGKYLTLPMPLTFNVLPNLGRISTELMLTGGRDTSKKMVEMLGIMMDASNPLGGSSPMVQIASPTITDPIV